MFRESLRQIERNDQELLEAKGICRERIRRKDCEVRFGKGLPAAADSGKRGSICAEENLCHARLFHPAAADGFQAVGRHFGSRA